MRGSRTTLGRLLGRLRGRLGPMETVREPAAWNGLEALEPRVLMSGDGLAAGLELRSDALDVTPGIEATPPGDETASPGPIIPANVFALPGSPIDTTLEAYLVVQNRRTDVDVDGLRTDAISIGGYALRASIDMSLGEFIMTERGDVEAALGEYLRRRPWLEGDASVVIDIEGGFGTSRWGWIQSVGGTLFENFVEAFRMRLEVARELMPDARLSLYGFMPDPSGESNWRFESQLEGIRAAASAGLLDPLDAISPVLYNRYGPDDVRFGSIEAATRLAFDAFGNLARSDGTTLDLFPLLSLNVFNGRSAHDDQLILEFDPDLGQTLNRQIAILQERGVGSFGIWQANGQVLGGDGLSLAAALGHVALPAAAVSAPLVIPGVGLAGVFETGAGRHVTSRSLNRLAASAHLPSFTLLDPADDLDDDDSGPEPPSPGYPQRLR